MLRTFLWRVLALLSLSVGVVGIVLPGLPTVEFLLLSAWSAGKGWPALEVWLLNHPRFGPPIKQWQESRAISRQSKWMASLSMGLGIVLIVSSSLPPWAKGVLPFSMMLVLVWLWRRPEPGPSRRQATHNIKA